MDTVAIKAQMLSILQERGPSLPKDVAAGLAEKVDTILAGALLAELVEQKKVLMSALKVGGSPLYYLPAGEARLTGFADRLHGPEKDAYAMLKDAGVLAEDALQPAIRVALARLRDFAKRIEISYQGRRAYFWRWYLLTPEETKDRVKALLTPAEEEAEKREEEPPAEEEAEERPADEQAVARQEAQEDPEEEKPEGKEEEPKGRGQEPRPQPQKPKGEAQETIAEPSHSEIPLIGRLRAKGIRVDQYRIINRKKDLMLMAEVPSELGMLKAIIVYKAKKVTDADLTEVMGLRDGERLTVLLCRDIGKKARDSAAKLGLVVRTQEEL